MKAIIKTNNKAPDIEGDNQDQQQVVGDIEGDNQDQQQSGDIEGDKDKESNATNEDKKILQSNTIETQTESKSLTEEECEEIMQKTLEEENVKLTKKQKNVIIN